MKIFDIVEELEKERKKNKQLKELCDKYEEEHKTTFKLWQKDIEKLKRIEQEIKIVSNVDLSVDNYITFINKLEEIIGDNK